MLDNRDRFEANILSNIVIQRLKVDRKQEDIHNPEMRFILYNFLSCMLALTACSSAPQIHDPEQLPLPTATMAKVFSAPKTVSATSLDVSPTTHPNPCVNDAIFKADLTIPDLSTVEPGAALRKRWQIMNTGTCDWGRDYRVVFMEGSALGASLEHALYPAPVGSDAQVTIEMVAPDVPGNYQGYWRLYDPVGVAFGHKLYIHITVAHSPTATPRNIPQEQG